LGLGASLTSSYVHYNLLVDRSFSSFCDVNATVSCTQAYLSPYGSFLGVPVALAGVFFFAIVLALAALSGRKTAQAGESAPAYIFALSTIGLAFTLYLGYASFFILHAVCILCVTTYVAVIAIFIISGGATSVPMSSLPARAGRDLKTLVRSPAALAVAALLAVGAISFNMLFPKETAAEAAAQAPADYPALTDQQKAEVEKWWDVQPKVDVPVPSDGAAVVMVKFNDYQCPPCRQTYEAYGPLLAKWAKTGKFKFVLKHFPLDSECNGAAPGGPHPAACEAAAAVVMAHRKNDGSAEKLEHWLFTNQGPPLLTPAQVKTAARDVAGIPDFDAKYASTLVEVRNDAGMGAMLGVKSTPTFFINGHMLPGGQDPRLIDAVIDLEMRRAAK
ncbi:MAG: vitamin K epoxide reductase family protein, partial [Vicinamibacterales bacterium]